MIENKREDNFEIESPIQFSNAFVLQFLEKHRIFMKVEQVVKIFILASKFRLSIMFINKF